MGKRSNFKRQPQDAYDTPESAVLPLLPFLPDGRFIYHEPCAGMGALWTAISKHKDAYATLSDIRIRGDLPLNSWCFECDALHLNEDIIGDAEYIITNPPWTRQLLHPMIEHFSAMKPTWLLFDADWMHTKQAAPYLRWCRKIVSVGRVKWIPDSPHTGKGNCAWYLFDQSVEGPAVVFYGRDNAQ